MFGYWFKNWSFNYKLGYGIVRIGLRTFYKKYELSGIENLPKDGGILFAVNHQNAFMDPIVVASQLDQSTYYLTRADIFKKKLVARIFNSINMLPIYRQRDGVNTLTSNEKTFDKCYDILKDNGCIIIFPEGNHNNQKKLRPIKKGIARIGLGSAEKYNFKNKIYIVPIGLNYSNHTNMGATLYMNFGKPISLEEYYTYYINHPNTTINVIIDKVEKEMEKLILNINSSNYELINELIVILQKKMNSLLQENNSLNSVFKLQQKLIRKTESLEKEDPVLYDHLLENISYLSSFLKDNNIRSHHLETSLNKGSHASLNIIFLTLFFPIHLLGLLNNYLPYKIPIWLVNKKIKDIHFHSSIKMSLGVVLFFLFWVIQFITICSFFGINIGATYLVSLPILAWFNYQYWILLLKTKGKLNYFKLKRVGKLSRAQDAYNEILSIVDYL